MRPVWAHGCLLTSACRVACAGIALQLDHENRFAEAAEVYQAALRLAPTSVDVLNNLGNLQRQTGELILPSPATNPCALPTPDSLVCWQGRHSLLLPVACFR